MTSSEMAGTEEKVFSSRAKAAIWAGVVLVCVVLVFVKVRVESGAALERARAEKVSAKYDRAGLYYRRSIRWYTPASSSVEAAVRELADLAAQREKAGDKGMALHLYRDLRGALYAIRHLTEPYKESRDRAEEKIAALMADQPPGTAADKERTREERRVRYLRQLRSVKAPDVGWSVVLLVGFFGWVLAAALFFWRGFTPEGALKARPALVWGGAIVVCFALWVVGMTQA